MKTQDKFGIIEKMFADLSQSQQVDILVCLYCSMYDGQKDKFLHETEND